SSWCDGVVMVDIPFVSWIHDQVPRVSSQRSRAPRVHGPVWHGGWLGRRARRQDRLQRVAETFEPIPFGISAARAYGQIFAAVRSCRRQPRKRFADLLIASIALAEELPLITRNPDDFVGLDDLVEVITV
ncbi:PIN domain-containing protein, partial [Cutibacterium granulosum]|uniref:PIN domain-containing protein n=1 Tax=Cutibacterium granulosum TaxID=33011 RepID=UPI002B23B057